MGGASIGRLLVYGALAAPALSMWRAAALSDSDYWAGDLIASSGTWSARMIILALSLTPLATLFGTNPAIRFAIRHRRAIGVSAFAYACIHLGLYVIDMENLRSILAEIGAPAMLAGWIAFAFLLPPALASSDPAMRLLGRSWKMVQRLVYPAAILTLLHWALIHDGSLEAILHFAPLALLQVLRAVRAHSRTLNERTI